MLGQLNPEQIEMLLMNEPVGRIGCHTDGRTYVVPVSYAYDGQRIIAHSSEGLKLKMMRANPKVCFQVEHVDNMANWQSVIAWGEFEELDNADAMVAMNLLVEKFRAYSTSETVQPDQGRQSKPPYRAIVYAIRLSEKTGRFEKR